MCCHFKSQNSKTRWYCRMAYAAINKHLGRNEDINFEHNDNTPEEAYAKNNDQKPPSCLEETNRNPKYVNIYHEEFLPEWIKPHMVYPKSSVTQRGFLGCGQFGMVQKGRFHDGMAV